MRVSSTNNKPVQNAEVTNASQAGKAAAAKDLRKKDKAEVAGTTTVPGSVNADISSKGKELARAKDLAASAPDIREEKVAELKKRIAAGKYNVDADALAGRMVDEHLKMSGIG